MTESEKREILLELKKGHDAFIDALRGVDEPRARRQPGPGRWSILECVEHVGVAERTLLSRLTGAALSETPIGNPAREARIRKRAADRSTRVESPEAATPGGRFGSLREAIAFFDCVRGETIQFVEECSGDPRCLIASHPLIPGPVNAFELLLLISVHPMRHAQQIEETRAALPA